MIKKLFKVIYKINILYILQFLIILKTHMDPIILLSLALAGVTYSNKNKAVNPKKSKKMARKIKKAAKRECHRDSTDNDIYRQAPFTNASIGEYEKIKENYNKMHMDNPRVISHYYPEQHTQDGGFRYNPDFNPDETADVIRSIIGPTSSGGSSLNGGSELRVTNFETFAPFSNPHNANGGDGSMMGLSEQEVLAENADNPREAFQPISNIANDKSEEDLRKLGHNNMVPFFGSNVKQNTRNDNVLNETKLEVYTGQFKLDKQHKTEVPILFTPHPQNLDQVVAPHEMDRYFPSNHGKKNNELPFEQTIVGPGLAQGFTDKPTGGFHNRTRILPKTSDQLFVNPRETYAGRIVRGKHIDRRTAQAKQFKHRPELLVTNFNGERNFTTTGSVVKPSAHPRILVRNTRREATGEIKGPARFTVAQNIVDRLIAKRKFSDKITYNNTPHRNLTNALGGNHHNEQEKSFENRANERCVTGPRSYNETVRNFNSFLKKQIAKYLDHARTTRKEQTIDAKNPVGYISNSTVKKGKVYNVNDLARTTVRETTEENTHEGFIQKAKKKGQVYNDNDMARTTHRETTEDNTHEGFIQEGKKKGTVYNQGDYARTTHRETTEDNDWLGGVENAVKKGKVYDPFDIARPTQKEYVNEINYTGVPDAGYMQSGKGYMTTDHTPKPTQKSYLSDWEYTGTAKVAGLPGAQKSYDAEYNFRQNFNKEIISKERVPTNVNAKLFVGTQYTNLDIKRLDSDRSRQYGFMKNPVYPNSYVPKTCNLGAVTTKKNISQSYDTRLDTTLTKAFKNNPLTQSLQSYA